MQNPTSEAETQTLYLIDGYAALFRAFFAIRKPLYSSTTGEPTQAILVFAQMLLKLYTQYAPDYVVVAWDAPGKTFREALYTRYAHLQTGGEPGEPGKPGEPADVPEPGEPETPLVPPPPFSAYKGTRPDMPDGLRQQRPRVLELLQIFGVPVIGKPGLEADDIIATLTHRVLDNPALDHLRVRIVTRDKDMEQLIGDRVSLFDIHTDEERGIAELWEKRGVLPAQIGDYLALTGDTVDNIPGVAGVGPKTAAKLLNEFGSLDAILDAAESDTIGETGRTGKLWETLRAARQSVSLSRQLVALQNDESLFFDLSNARTGPFPEDGMAQFCDTLGFVHLKDRCCRAAQEIAQKANPAVENGGV